MPDDRRSAPRARLTGVHIVYESASGEPHDAPVMDLARGGLFVRTPAPLPVGKRLSLEIAVAGENAAWPALGRVIWVREADEGDDRPAGMGVKLIDVEDEVVAAIDRLVATRERTEPGVGSKAPPAREKTVLGLGLPSELTRPTPVVVVVPGFDSIGEPPADAAPPPAPPERVGAAAASPEPEPSVVVPELDGLGREASIAIDLVSKKESRPPVAPAASELQKKGGAGVYWILLLIAMAVAGYVFRDRIMAEWDAQLGEHAATTSPTPIPTPTPTPTTSPTPVLSPSPASVVASPSASGSATATASASASASVSASSSASAHAATSASSAAKKAPRPPVGPQHRPAVQDESPY